MRTALSGITAVALVACGQGSVEVVLRLPEAEAARPAGATTITVRADRAGADPVTLTAPIRDGAFDLGALPVDAYTGMTVELRSAAGGLAGYGRASGEVDVAPDGAALFEIPVRRPRTYLAGPTPDATVDAPLTAATTTLLRTDRGGTTVEIAPIQVAPAPAGTVLTAAGPDLFLGAGTGIFRLDTNADAFVDPALATLPAVVVDLAADPSGRYLVAGAGTGLHVIEVATGAVRSFDAGGPVTSVTVALDGDGALAAVGVVDGARTTAACPRSSSLVVASLTAPEAGARTIADVGGVADIGGSTTRPLVVVADRCGDRVTVVELGVDQVQPVSAAAATPCTDAKDVVCAPSAVVVLGGRAWVAGTVPALLLCPNNAPLPCPSPTVDYTRTGAHHQLATIDLGATHQVERVAVLSELQQTIEPVAGQNLALSRIIKARQADVPTMAVSADGSSITLTSNAGGRVGGLVVTDPVFGNDSPLIPPIAVHTSVQLTLSTQTGALESAVRTRCAVCENERVTAAGFELGTQCVLEDTWQLADWNCAPNPGGAPVTNFEGGAAASLFGQP